MGLDLPKECRIETTIENHDYLAQESNGLASADGTIICGTGGGNIVRAVYRVVFAHKEAEVGKFRKKLLHGENEPERLASASRRKRS